MCFISSKNGRKEDDKMADILGIYVGLFFIICSWSFLYKPNPLFRFATATVVGAGVGHTTVIALNSINSLVIDGILAGKIVSVLALIAGLTLYGQFVRPINYLPRYGMAVIVGTFIGLNVGPEIASRFLRQLGNVSKPLIGATPLDTFNQIMVTVFVLCVILYFIFTTRITPPKVIYEPVQKIARFALSISFGYTVSTYVLSRYANAIDRFIWLFFTWLNLG
jgi:hypothetical protein